MSPSHSASLCHNVLLAGLANASASSKVSIFFLFFRKTTVFGTNLCIAVLPQWQNSERGATVFVGSAPSPRRWDHPARPLLSTAVPTWRTSVRDRALGSPLLLPPSSPPLLKCYGQTAREIRLCSVSRSVRPCFFFYMKSGGKKTG